jgi:hypothetical protein
VNEVKEESKQRKTQNIRENVDIDELHFSTQIKLKKSGMIAASKVLN